MIGQKLIEAAGNGISTGDVAEAIDFDGTNDYLSRSSDLTGNADGKTFTLSFWLYKPGTQAVDANVIDFSDSSSPGANSTFIARWYVNFGFIRIFGYDNTNTQIFQRDLNFGANVAIYSTWVHFLISVNLNTGVASGYVNDISSISGTLNTNANIKFTQPYISIARRNVSPGYLAARLSNVFLDYTYRDLSVTANRRLFVTADLKPADGQASLNPILYLPLNDPTAPGANAGTGGDFTLTGTVARSGRGPNQYNAPYSDLDGTADYLSRTTALTGIADGKQFTFAWTGSVDSLAAASKVLSIGSTTLERFAVNMGDTGELLITGRDSGGILVLGAGTTTNYISANRNYQIIISVDLTDTAKRHLYINGESYDGWGAYTNTDIDFLPTGTPACTVGRTCSSAGLFFNGRLGALWFNTSYIDLSVAANLAKFVTGTGIDAKPVDLGANGELPTGTSPLIYLPMYGNNAGKNYGTGGDFTVNSGPYTGARGPNEFWGNKADFNGTTGYLSRTSALSGVSDSKTFSVSFNYNPDTIPAGQDYIFAMSNGTSNRGIFIQLSSNNLRFFAYDSAGNGILQAAVTSPTFSAGTNYYVQASVDLTNTSNRSIYINGAVATVTWSTYTNSTINHTASTQRIGAAADGSAVDFIDGKLSEFYFTTEYIDFSQEANRLKFRDAFGNPVNLTQQIEDAAIPNPAIYMRFDPASFGTNSGTGGNFTVNGTITDGGQL